MPAGLLGLPGAERADWSAATRKRLQRGAGLKGSGGFGRSWSATLALLDGLFLFVLLQRFRCLETGFVGLSRRLLLVEAGISLESC